MITSRFTVGGAPAAVVVSLVVAAQLTWGSAPALGAVSPAPGRPPGQAAGFSGDGGPATKAWLGPEVVTLDQRGDLIVADTTNGRIRRITAWPAK